MFMLTVAQRGKLQQSHRECSGSNPPRGSALFQRGTWPAASCAAFRFPGRIAGLDMPLSALADDLSYLTGRIVLDKTGLTGNYDIALDWTPDEAGPPLPNSPFPQPDPNGPTLEGALEDQLGLKLAPARGSVELLVIDHIEPPTPN